MALAVGVEVLGHDDGSIEIVGREETNPESAAIPPAEDPTTTRCVNELSANAPPYRLPADFSRCPQSPKNDSREQSPPINIFYNAYGRGCEHLTQALLNVQCSS